MRNTALFALMLLAGCGGGGAGEPTLPATNQTDQNNQQDDPVISIPVVITPDPVEVNDPVVNDPVEVNNGNLPTGEPADNRLQEVDLLDNGLIFFEGSELPNLTRVSAGSEMPSSGGLDSASPEFDALRYPTASFANGCGNLINAIKLDRGETDGSGFHRPPSGSGYATVSVHWFFEQGYVVAIGSAGVLNYAGPCEFIDYRFTPQNKPVKPVEPDPVEFTQVSSGFTSYGAATIRMRVTNNQSSDIYNVGCNVNALQGNTILDSAFIYFINGATISSGRSAEEEGIFFDLTSLNGLDIDADCSFLDR